MKPVAAEMATDVAPLTLRFVGIKLRQRVRTDVITLFPMSTVLSRNVLLGLTASDVLSNQPSQPTLGHVLPHVANTNSFRMSGVANVLTTIELDVALVSPVAVNVSVSVLAPVSVRSVN